MWVMTQEGFYSVVAFDSSKVSTETKNAEDHLLVRARVRKDLEALIKYVPCLEIRRDESADYMFRTVMTREQWMACLAGATVEIDYTNFKNRVSSSQGDNRSGVYHRVWSTLLALQPGPRRSSGIQSPS
jgi:hypothetical protein